MSDQPKKWYKFLHLAEYWHNSTVHSTTQLTPFQALYGRPPPKIPDYVTGSSSITSLEEPLQARHLVLQQLKENLTKSRKQMEVQANKKRRDHTFNVGDLVLLRLQPYRQSTVQRRSSQKLAKRFFGPFRVLECIGSVAYKLDLPPDSKIHPVVHISLLRPYYSGTQPGSAPVALSDPQGQEQSKDEVTNMAAHKNVPHVSDSSKEETLNFSPSNEIPSTNLTHPNSPNTLTDSTTLLPSGLSPPLDTIALSPHIQPSPFIQIPSKITTKQLVPTNNSPHTPKKDYKLQSEPSKPLVIPTTDSDTRPSTLPFSEPPRGKLNLEDKVLGEPASIVSKGHPKGIKLPRARKMSIKLKDFYRY